MQNNQIDTMHWGYIAASSDEREKAESDGVASLGRPLKVYSYDAFTQANIDARCDAKNSGQETYAVLQVSIPPVPYTQEVVIPTDKLEGVRLLGSTVTRIAKRK